MISEWVDPLEEPMRFPSELALGLLAITFLYVLYLRTIYGLRVGDKWGKWTVVRVVGDTTQLINDNRDSMYCPIGRLWKLRWPLKN
jgi:hypothetical protein